MKRSPFSPPFRAAFACILATAAYTIPATMTRAQDAAPKGASSTVSGTQKIPSISLDLNDAPIRQALEQLFATAKVDFSIDPNVTGFITLRVTDQPFENALTLVLRSASEPLTYSREGNVFIVKPLVTPTTVRRTLLPSRFSPVVPNMSGKLTLDTQRRVSFDGTASIRSLLMQLMQQNGPEGTPYIIAPQVSGDLTITLDKVPFDTALKYLLSSAEPKLTFKKEGSVYIFAQQNLK